MNSDPDPAARVRAHYDDLLAAHYTWMATGGDYAAGVAESAAWLKSFGLNAGAHALDLGCGPGMQCAALLRLGFARVVAVDLSAPLIAELEARNAEAIRDGRLHAVIGDLLDATFFQGTAPFDLILCAGDTLTHLPDLAAVGRLIEQSHAGLAPGGRLALRFRDLTRDLAGPDRFIPVRADDSRVMTCFLEAVSADRLAVTDLIHLRQPDGAWQLRKSAYFKSRLAPAAVAGQLRAAGFDLEHEATAPSGLVTLVARRR